MRSDGVGGDEKIAAKIRRLDQPTTSKTSERKQVKLLDIWALNKRHMNPNVERKTTYIHQGLTAYYGTDQGRLSVGSGYHVCRF